MKVEDVKSYKQIYKNIHVPFSVAEEKWLFQRDLLGEQDAPRSAYYRYMPYAYAVAGLILLLSASLFIVQAAQPGSSFYGVKALTKQVYSHLTKPFAPENNGGSVTSNVSHTLPPTSLPTKNLVLPTVTTHPTSKEEMHESTSAQEHEHESDVKGISATRAPQISGSQNHNESDNHSQDNNNSQQHGSNSQNSHEDNSDSNHSNNFHKGDN